MMQAMRVSSPVVGNSLISSSVAHSDRATSYGQLLTCKPQPLIVCQVDSKKSKTSSSESSRRSLMIATVASLTGAAAAGFVSQPESAQAKRKPPPPSEEKTPAEEKNLSSLDAKKLANIRRKEALQAQLEVQKAKAKVVREPAQAPQDMFGQRPEQSSGSKLSEALEQGPLEALSQTSE